MSLAESLNNETLDGTMSVADEPLKIETRDKTMSINAMTDVMLEMGQGHVKPDPSTDAFHIDREEIGRSIETWCKKEDGEKHSQIEKEMTFNVSI